MKLGGPLALAAALVLTGCGMQAPPPVSQKVKDYHATRATQLPTPAPTREPVTIPASLLEAGTKTLIFGDSWTDGYIAQPREAGYAYVIAEKFGWNNEVIARGGTGYSNRGPDGRGMYAESLGALPADEEVQLVILQGGLNDIYGATDAATHQKDVAAAFATAKVRFPSATIVVLGPLQASFPLPVRLREVDAVIQVEARAAGLAYISPLSEGWISVNSYDALMDKKAYHPNTEGHLHYAEKLEAALRAIATSA